MAMVARSARRRTATLTSGFLASTLGRPPSLACMRSQIASLARRATNCVFLRLALVPWASMAKVAESERWSSQGRVATLS